MTQLVLEVPEDLGKQRVKTGRLSVPRLGVLRGIRKGGVRKLHSRPRLTASGKKFPKPEMKSRG